jgi:hypothetical protein
VEGKLGKLVQIANARLLEPIKAHPANARNGESHAEQLHFVPGWRQRQNPRSKVSSRTIKRSETRIGGFGVNAMVQEGLNFLHRHIQGFFHEAPHRQLIFLQLHKFRITVIESSLFQGLAIWVCVLLHQSECFPLNLATSQALCVVPSRTNEAISSIQLINGLLYQC